MTQQRVYFLRHGPAGNKSEWRLKDSERPLTAEGLAEVRAVSRALAGANLGVGVVVTSPFARCLQTAHELAKALGPDVALSIDVRVAPGFDRSDLDELLGEHRGERIVVVGHEPDLSTVIGAVTGGRVRLRKTAFVRIDLDSSSPAHGELVWLVQPKQLLAQ